MEKGEDSGVVSVRSQRSSNGQKANWGAAKHSKADSGHQCLTTHWQLYRVILMAYPTCPHCALALSVVLPPFPSPALGS